MRRQFLISVGLVLLAGCGGSANLDDPRTAELMALSAPEHYAVRTIAREMVGRCPAYSYDEVLASAITNERVKNGQLVAAQVREAAELETDVKRRSLAAKCGTSYSRLNTCAVLEDETARQTPVSVLVYKRG